MRPVAPPARVIRVATPTLERGAASVRVAQPELGQDTYFLVHTQGAIDADVIKAAFRVQMNIDVTATAVMGFNEETQCDDHAASPPEQPPSSLRFTTASVSALGPSPSGLEPPLVSGIDRTPFATSLPLRRFCTLPPFAKATQPAATQPRGATSSRSSATPLPATDTAKGSTDKTRSEGPAFSLRGPQRGKASAGTQKPSTTTQTSEQPSFFCTTTGLSGARPTKANSSGKHRGPAAVSPLKRSHVLRSRAPRASSHRSTLTEVGQSTAPSSPGTPLFASSTQVG